MVIFLLPVMINIDRPVLNCFEVSDMPIKRDSIVFQLPVIVLICLAAVGIAFAQKTNGAPVGSKHVHHAQKDVETERNPNSKFVVPDLEVFTQDGNRVKFYSDLVKGKKVLINFTYTSCNLTCPMAGRNFEKLQELLGDDLGTNVFLISVTTDPKIDTPATFKSWGEKFNRRNGWTLVSGEEKVVSQLLMNLIGKEPGQGLHTSFLILFDDANGAWETSSSLRDPKVLISQLNGLGKNPKK